MNRIEEQYNLNQLKVLLERENTHIARTLKSEFNVTKLRGFYGKHFPQIPEEWFERNCFSSSIDGKPSSLWIRMIVTDDQVVIRRLTDAEILDIGRALEKPSSVFEEPEEINIYTVPCPDCGLDVRVVRIGTVRTKAERKPRYRCKNCRKTFYYRGENK